MALAFSQQGVAWCVLRLASFVLNGPQDYPVRLDVHRVLGRVGNVWIKRTPLLKAWHSYTTLGAQNEKYNYRWGKVWSDKAAEYTELCNELGLSWEVDSKGTCIILSHTKLGSSSPKFQLDLYMKESRWSVGFHQ
jgi:hypothetical protein